MRAAIVRLQRLEMNWTLFVSGDLHLAVCRCLASLGESFNAAQSLRLTLALSLALSLGLGHSCTLPPPRPPLLVCPSYALELFSTFPLADPYILLFFITIWTLLTLPVPLLLCKEHTALL